MLRRLALVVLVQASGCTLILGYPELGREDDGASCTDGRDDDGDGAIDCDDPSCGGYCEESARACANGVDDDGDGRVDLDDARCWPFGVPVLHRCATVPGTRLSSDADGTPEGWATIGGARIDPARHGLVVCAPDGARTIEPLTGGLDGTDISFSVPGGSDGLVWIAPFDHVGAHGPDRAEVVELELSGGVAALRSGGREGRTHVVALADRDGFSFQITFDVATRTVRVTVSRPDGTVRLEAPLPAAWRDTDALVLGVTGTQTLPDRCLVVQHVSVDRPPSDPCGVEVPQFARTFPMQPSSVASDGTLACAAVGSVPWTSSDRLHWTASDSEPRVLGVAWDPGTRAFVAAVDDGSQGLRLFTSPTCAGLRGLTVTTGVESPSDLVAFAIAPRVPRGPSSWQLAVRDGTDRVRVLASDGGAAGPFVPGGALPRLPSAATSAAARDAALHLSFVGPDPVLLLADPVSGGLSAWVLAGSASAARWIAVGDPLLAPSSLPSTFDRWRITSGALLAAEGVVTLVYSADGDYCSGCVEPAGTAGLEWQLRCAGDACGAACTVDEECDDADPCTERERCDTTFGRCTWNGTDADGDGHVAAACMGDDCDDTSAGVYPGAYDDCGPVDANCDGQVGGTIGPDLCDGLMEDDDCDGHVDEDTDLANDPGNCGACGVVCGASYAETACATGVCGITRCVGPHIDLDREPANGCEYACAYSAVEVCNGVDDDCDGSTDEAPIAGDDPANCGACGRPCVLAHAVAGCRSGACFVASCVGGASNPNGIDEDGCETPVCLAVELCNGLDDDCDGSTDESPIDVGAVCGITFGGCHAGILTCSGGTLYCAGESAPSPEVCNGLDDDCNGTSDDLPQNGSPCGADVGVCRAGTFACFRGMEVCIGEIGPSAETCNGLDDDCDGHVDDGTPCAGTQVCIDAACVDRCASTLPRCPAGRVEEHAGGVCFCR